MTSTPCSPPRPCSCRERAPEVRTRWVITLEHRLTPGDSPTSGWPEKMQRPSLRSVLGKHRSSRWHHDTPKISSSPGWLSPSVPFESERELGGTSAFPADSVRHRSRRHHIPRPFRVSNTPRRSRRCEVSGRRSGWRENRLPSRNCIRGCPGGAERTAVIEPRWSSGGRWLQRGQSVSARNRLRGCDRLVRPTAATESAGFQQNRSTVLCDSS